MCAEQENVIYPQLTKLACRASMSIRPAFSGGTWEKPPTREAEMVLCVVVCSRFVRATTFSVAELANED
jgi:hypothetical protein